jgi:hypothetical protein
MIEKREKTMCGKREEEVRKAISRQRKGEEKQGNRRRDREG